MGISWQTTKRQHRFSVYSEVDVLDRLGSPITTSDALMAYFLFSSSGQWHVFAALMAIISMSIWLYQYFDE